MSDFETMLAEFQPKNWIALAAVAKHLATVYETIADFRLLGLQDMINGAKNKTVAVSEGVNEFSDIKIKSCTYYELFLGAKAAAIELSQRNVNPSLAAPNFQDAAQIVERVREAAAHGEVIMDLVAAARNAINSNILSNTAQFEIRVNPPKGDYSFSHFDVNLPLIVSYRRNKGFLKVRDAVLLDVIESEVGLFPPKVRQAVASSLKVVR